MRPKTLKKTSLPLIALLLQLTSIQSIYFNLPARGQKCIRDEAKADTTISGEYSIELVPAGIVNIKITDSNDGLLFEKENAEDGVFTFTLDKKDIFSICFNTDYVNGITATQIYELNKRNKKHPHQIELKIKKGLPEHDFDADSVLENILNMLLLRDD